MIRLLSPARAILALLGLVFSPGLLYGQWTLGERGRVAVSLTAVAQRTGQRFDFRGGRQKWLGEGRMEATVLFADVVVGLSQRLDLWVQGSYLDISLSRFDLRVDPARADTIGNSGVSDIRVWLRGSLWKSETGDRTVALRVGFKAPTGSSPLDAEILNLGEGQWDFEGFLELGGRFLGDRVTVTGVGGYRDRHLNAERAWDPGGEWVLSGGTSVGTWSSLTLSAGFNALIGRRMTVLGVRTASARRLFVLQGGFALGLGRWTLTGGVGWPAYGRDMPAGSQIVLGIGLPVS